MALRGSLVGSALAVLGLCLLLVRVDLLRRLAHPLSAAGEMTLTLDTVHAFVLSNRGTGTFDSVGYHLSHVVAALTFAPLWLWRFRRGPLESVVHAASTASGRALVPIAPPAVG